MGKFIRGRNVLAACRVCGKKTHSDLDGNNLELCRRCMELSDKEITHLDTHDKDNPDPNCPWCKGEDPFADIAKEKEARMKQKESVSNRELAVKLIENDEPDQCYGCGRYAEPGEVFKTKTVDLDPGDPEVGPRPDVQDVGFCPDCIDKPKSEWPLHNDDAVEEKVKEINGKKYNVFSVASFSHRDRSVDDLDKLGVRDIIQGHPESLEIYVPVEYRDIAMKYFHG